GSSPMLMSSPAAARASASMPIATSPTPEIFVARMSVSGPIWFGRCGPPETLSPRWTPKADKGANPREGALAGKAAGSREGATATIATAGTATPEPTPTPLSTGLGSRPVRAPPERQTTS
uniref:Uncharacterized protein n=1 Tax=Spermophilus dauricus TaxID=99837 RepID=A0A8C9PN87_SPEDA